MPLQYIPKPIKAVVNDVTAIRAFAVTYTNNRSRPLMVIINTRHEVILAGLWLYCRGYVDGNVLNTSGWSITPGVGVRIYGTITLMVSPHSTYEVTSVSDGGINGINQIFDWIEVEL